MGQAVVDETSSSTAGSADCSPLATARQGTYDSSNSGGTCYDFHRMSFSSPLTPTAGIRVVLLFLDHAAWCGLGYLSLVLAVLADIDGTHACWIVAVRLINRLGHRLRGRLVRIALGGGLGRNYGFRIRISGQPVAPSRPPDGAESAHGNDGSDDGEISRIRI